LEGSIHVSFYVAGYILKEQDSVRLKIFAATYGPWEDQLVEKVPVFMKSEGTLPFLQACHELREPSPNAQILFI